MPEQNYHVTLRFLGQLDPDQIVSAQAQVAALKGCVVTGMAVRVTGFPSSSKSRTLVAELADHARLAGWAAQLAAAPGPAHKHFRPHITLARSQRPLSLPVPELAQPVAVRLLSPGLYESVAGPQGSCYRLVQTVA